MMMIGVKIGTDPPQELHYQLDIVEAAGLPFRLAWPRTIQLQNRLIWKHHECCNICAIDRRCQGYDGGQAGKVGGSKAMRVGHMRQERNRLLFCERAFKH